MTSCGKMNVIPLDEPGEPRCSNLTVPLFRFRHIEGCLRKYLDNLAWEQWTALATDDIPSDLVNLLTSMCQALIGHISTLVFQDIHPQVSCCPHIHDPRDKESPADRMNVEPLRDGCSYCRVTEGDIQASLGNIFDKCFGRALDVAQRRSCDSDKLLTLFSVSIAKNVNSALSHITGSTSLQSDESTSLPNIVGMVYSVVNILKVCVKTLAPPSADSESSSYSIIVLPDFEDDNDCVGKGNLGSKGKSHTFQTTDVKNLDSESSESDEKCSLTPESSDAPQYSTGTLPTPRGIDTFLILCLENLVAHVSEKTHTSAVKLNFQQIVADIRQKIGGDLTPLKTVKNLYIIMYKDLCRKFRSEYVLPFVMEKCDPTFMAAVMETLKAELKKLGASNNVLRSFKRNKSVAPAPENKTQQSDSEENVPSGSTDSQRNRPKNRIIRAFSSFFSILRRVFSCCMSSESETE